MHLLKFFKQSFILLFDTLSCRNKSVSSSRETKHHTSNIADEYILEHPVISCGDRNDQVHILLNSRTLPDLSIDTTNIATTHGGLSISRQTCCRRSEASSTRSLSPTHSFAARSSFEGCPRCGSDGFGSPLTPSGSSIMTASDTLKKRLRVARTECPRGSGAYMVPRCQQELLITEDSIIHETQMRGVLLGADKAQWIRKNSMRLFGTLAQLQREEKIVDFMAEGISDQQLPFKRIIGDWRDYYLKGREGETIGPLEKWDDEQREEFYNAQQMMTAPVFKLYRHYEFDDSTVLPFIDFPAAEGEAKDYRGGGYSEIHIRCIHPSHHNFWDSTQPGVLNRVAIKKLIDPDEDEYQKEATILRALAPKKHPHLLRLLATFQQTKSQEGLKWHFIFPCADANLRAYWDTIEPNPSFEEKTVIWALKQMAGITDGLSQVHIHQVTVPLSVKGAGGIRKKDGKTMSVEKGEQWYGRHGDIKPENLLWFSKDPENVDDRGMLKVADFGLGRFHGLDSRSKVPPQSVAGTITYEPPELKLGTPVSRAYDIWSLGCLFLEFVTWLLMGAQAVHDFADARAEPYPSAPKMSDDSFFAVFLENGEPTSAEVREGVKKWVRSLHQHQCCTQLLHDLLDMVMNEMLVVDRDERTSATMLCRSFADLTNRVKGDIRYALQPTPWPAAATPDTPKDLSSDAQVEPSIRPLRRKLTVHFEDGFS